MVTGFDGNPFPKMLVPMTISEYMIGVKYGLFNSTTAKSHI
jgi:ribosomal protein S19